MTVRCYLPPRRWAAAFIRSRCWARASRCCWARSKPCCTASPPAPGAPAALSSARCWANERIVGKRNNSTIGTSRPISASVRDGTPVPPVSFSGEQALLDRFLSFDAEGLLRMPRPERSELYVAARYRLSPIQLTGSLRIVSLFFDVGARTSDWSTARLEVKR